MKRTLRGIPAETIVGYLERFRRPEASSPESPQRVDGYDSEDRPCTIVTGECWRAAVVALPPVHVGAIRLSQVELTVEGDEPVHSELIAFLEVRLARGGG